MSYANWNPTAFYLTNDLVYDGNEDYIALADNTNTQPSTHPLVWSVVAPPGPPTGLANVVTADGSGILSVVAGNTATLSSALVNDPNITLTPAAPPSKDLTIGVNSALTSITSISGAAIAINDLASLDGTNVTLTNIQSINGTNLADYGIASIANPNTSTTIATASLLSLTSILSLTFVDTNPSFVAPTNQLLWYQVIGPNTIQINSSAPAGVPGGSLVIAWRLLVA
jgi:hypothetical protein